jgi:hypothetical protein
MNLPVSQPSELLLDASYRDLANWIHGADEFNKFFRFSDGRGIANAQGFRPKSRNGGSTVITECGFCVLVTTLREPEWPDSLDPDSGLLTYYGDNRIPGKAIADTPIGGNRLLEHTFELLHNGDRKSICPFLCFQKYTGAGGVYMRFLGLAVPGAHGVSSLDDLVAVWRRKGNERFQNYKATFTILNAGEVSHAWLEAIVSGIPPTAAEECPPALAKWVKTGKYDALVTERKIAPRSKIDQQPKNANELNVLARVASLTPRQFEFAAAELLPLMDPRFINIEVTREVRDGGRDVTALYRVGHGDHGIGLHVSVEAKLWKETGAVGVKPMMRLISRLKYRDFGVFITTSFFDRTVQAELIEDGHPVILVSGGDIARILIANEKQGDALERWIGSIKHAEDAG